MKGGKKGGIRKRYKRRNKYDRQDILYETRGNRNGK